MTRISEIDRPGIPLRLASRIDERMFGAVPTPERIMARRPSLMLGLGALYGAIESFAKVEAPLRALIRDAGNCGLHRLARNPRRSDRRRLGFASSVLSGHRRSASAAARVPPVTV